MGDQVAIGNSMLLGRQTRLESANKELEAEAQSAEREQSETSSTYHDGIAVGLRKAREIFTKHGLLA